MAQGRADLAAQGLTLSAKRRTAAKALEREVEAALSSLCMDGTRFRVGFEWEEAEAGGGVPVPGAGVRHSTRHGIDLETAGRDIDRPWSLSLTLRPPRWQSLVTCFVCLPQTLSGRTQTQSTRPRALGLTGCRF